ncbi:MAG: glycosyltransferase [Cyclobacteriaceae bacterium]|nr:glycosyltransferase [Cyclobacteriaceae bacterium]
MKIAIIGAKGYPIVYGGFDTFVKELSERLVKRDVTVTVYCHRAMFTERPKMVNGIHLVYTPAVETKILTQLSHSFFSFIHACFSDVDIILAVNPANGPFGYLARLFGKKCLINMDGLEWKRPKWKGLGALYFLWASRIATKAFHRIINDSEEMRKVYLELFQKDSRVIAYGANIRYSSNPGLIKKWGIEAEKYYLIVGRMIPDNNVDLIIRGFSQSKTNKKLVIVGDAPFNDRYANQVKAMKELDDRLLFTGYVNDQDELAELYHNCYMYVHGHEFGGTNPALLKALAYGTAILALDTRFNREVLQEGEFGLFFKKSEEDFSERIAQYDKDENLVISMKEKSRNGLWEKYNWDVITSNYIDVFAQLTGGSTLSS